jgi:hydroxymethylglutaryl-CoA lyase
MPPLSTNESSKFLRNLPRKVKIHEVCPREGLQSQSVVLNTDDKLKLVTELSHTGLTRIETTGFFHPVKFPQLADANELMQQVKRREGVRYSVHIPNRVGFERALKVAADSVIICLAASDETARREDDDCRSTDECMTTKLQWLAKDAKSKDMWVRIFLTNAWGCPYEGPIPPERVLRICQSLLEYGVDEICLADNLAAATPADVDTLLAKVSEVVPVEKLAVHFHDNRGMAIGNVLASLARGVGVVDTSTAGLGGHANCKYSPRNPSMVATEDVLFLIHGLGIDSGIDIEKVRQAGRNVAERLHVPVMGRYSEAGPVERVP